MSEEAFSRPETPPMSAGWHRARQAYLDRLEEEQAKELLAREQASRTAEEILHEEKEQVREFFTELFPMLKGPLQMREERREDIELEVRELEAEQRSTVCNDRTIQIVLLKTILDGKVIDQHSLSALLPILQTEDSLKKESPDSLLYTLRILIDQFGCDGWLKQIDPKTT